MSEERISIKKAAPIIIVAWILSLITSLALVSVAPSIFPVTKLADDSVTSTKILDGTIEATDLAAGSFPHASSYSATVASTTSSTWSDMPEMSVNIVLNRKSDLLIIFSSEAELSASGGSLYARAMVGSAVSKPEWVVLTQESRWSSCSFVFYLPNVSAGTYTVKIMWRVEPFIIQGMVRNRALNVIALPA